MKEIKCIRNKKAWVIFTTKLLLKEERMINQWKKKNKVNKCKRKCGLPEVCSCDIPQYEKMNINNNYFCNNCCLWKCRCYKTLPRVIAPLIFDGMR